MGVGLQQHVAMGVVVHQRLDLRHAASLALPPRVCVTPHGAIHAGAREYGAALGRGEIEGEPGAGGQGCARAGLLGDRIKLHTG